MVRRINISNMITKLDYYLERKEYDKAEALLSYWLQQARICRDVNGQLSIYNEQLGLFRNTGRRQETYDVIERAIALITDETKGLQDTIAAGTTYLNIATAYKIYNENLMSIKYYEKASEIYKKTLKDDDIRMAGLYNNFALALVAEKRFQVAMKQYESALQITLKNDAKLDAAITYLNMADLCVAMNGLQEAEEEVGKYLEEAIALLDSESLERNGHYAAICERCASVFGYYGYFLYEQELRERIKKIESDMKASE